MAEIYTIPHRKKINNNSRIKLAYITRGIEGNGGIGTDTSKLIWEGISTAVKEQNIDLYTFSGGHDTTAINNYIYELLSDNSVDGIITWASSKADEAIKLLSKFQKTPIISLSVDLKKNPVVTIDNISGMKSMIYHLIKHHNLSKIAFVQGPINHIYAKERLKAYKETLIEFNIPIKDELISSPHEWDKETGYRAIELFLENRALKIKKDIEAIVCVNDRIAIGVIEALRNRGYDCPSNIVVTGFNDLDEAKNYSPSISTVAMPFYEQGRQAVVQIKKLIESGKIPRINKLSSISVIHESCGCPNMWIEPNTTLSPLNRDIFEVICYIRSNINEIKGSHKYLEYLFSPHEFESLMDSFILSITRLTPNNILKKIKSILRSNYNIDLYQWQTLFSFYRKIIYSITNNTQVLLLCENILVRAIGLIMDRHIKSGAEREIKAMLSAENLKKIDKNLSGTMDLESIKMAMVEILPQTDIKSFYLILFDRDKCMSPNIPKESLLYLGYKDQELVKIGSSGIRFLTKDILPKGYLQSNKRKSYLLKALPNGNHRLGYLVFELGLDDGGIYGSITQKLSNSISNSYLARDLKHQTEKLKRSNNKLIEQQYILDTFIESLPDLIHFKDKKGNITKSNNAFLQKMGYKHQKEVLGRPGIDFFPKKQREKIKYYEKIILHNREKFLNTNEEINFRDSPEWYMTTRMPLYNYLGEINGMVEISRDITQLKSINDNLEKSLNELKNTQKQLVEAEKMIALGELVVGVAHEINTPLGVCITASTYLAIQLNNFIEKYSIRTGESLNINETLNLITDNLNRVSKLVHDFKQISTQPPISELMYIDMYNFLTYKISTFKQHLSRETDISISCDPKLKLHSYPDILEIIMTHLFNNSNEHAYSKNEILRIKLEVLQDVDRVIIKFRDYGKGLDKDVLDNVFNPFFTTKRGLGFSGLGMHIVYNLIYNTLKGTISCISQQGDGVTYCITLPQPID